MSGYFPGRTDAREWLRPWKLFSFAVGMAWLLYGAMNYRVADWDIGVSLLMGGLTYLFAPWSVRTILGAFRPWKVDSLPRIAGALAVAWFVVDGVYYAYHTLVGNEMYRIENFYASTPLYFICGCLWLYRGTLREFLGEVRNLRLERR
jgi:hypothetical protein